jgi:hypothetical protein
LMNMVLKNENWEKCLIYGWHFSVWQNTRRAFQGTKGVLWHIQEAWLKLSPSKWHFFKMEVEYLGHNISRDGIKIYSNKQSWES